VRQVRDVGTVVDLDAVHGERIGGLGEGIRGTGTQGMVGGLSLSHGAVGTGGFFGMRNPIIMLHFFRRMAEWVHVRNNNGILVVVER